MKRIYEEVAKEHFKSNRQMLFLAGPRGVGKTTASRQLTDIFPQHDRFCWSKPNDRLLLLGGEQQVADRLQSSLVVFDELHHHNSWKNFLTRFHDANQDRHVLAIGGIGHETLNGRAFTSRMHPLSVAELSFEKLLSQEINLTPRAVDEEAFQRLLQLGGFPEPFFKGQAKFHAQWKKRIDEQLLQEDIRELTRIQALKPLETLMELVKLQVGQLTAYTLLASRLGVSIETVQKWLSVLSEFHYCYAIQPWTWGIPRSLLKQPKYYLLDWSAVDNLQARQENWVASHLLKAVHFWTDQGFGVYGLHYLRDKEKREVDFVVTKNGKPWFLVDCGTSLETLKYYQEQTGAKHAFLVDFEKPFEEKNYFEHQTPVVASARTLMAQWV